MKNIDARREVLDMLWEKAYSGGLREHRKIKDVDVTLQALDEIEQSRWDDVPMLMGVVDKAIKKVNEEEDRGLATTADKYKLEIARAIIDYIRSKK